MAEPRIEPSTVIEAVEHYVRAELSDAEKYENSTPLDESGIWSLHVLAAKIYALGYDDGERAEAARASAQVTRLREAHNTALKAAITAEPEAVGS